MDVAVAALPPGSDPGEMARTDPDGLRAAIEGAKPFLQFRVERILDAAELSTPEGRARAADNALAAVAEHPDNLVRDQYLMQVAERCRLEPLLLRDRLEQLRHEGPRKAPGGERPRTPRPESPGSSRAAAGDRGDQWVREPDDGDWDSDGFDGGGVPAGAAAGWKGATGGPHRSDREFRPGLEALRLAIHRPDDVGHLEAALFRDDLQREAFLVLAEADPAAELHEVIESAPPQVRALLVRLTVEEPMGEPDDVVLQLVRDAARRELQLITAEARTSPEVVEEAAAAAAWVQELDDPAASIAATARLVAWLVVRAQKDTPGRGS
jgi:DNA primase